MNLIKPTMRFYLFIITLFLSETTTAQVNATGTNNISIPKMIKSKTNYLKSVFIFAGVLMSYYWFFFKKDIYEDRICDLFKLKVKNKISEVYQSKVLVFTINLNDTPFPMYFDIVYDEIKQIQKGEIMMLPLPGDSIIKEENSKFIKFKRGNKIFVAKLNLKNCD